MEKVTGLGGVFFRAENPQALRQWYEDHLGIIDPPNGVWQQEAGPTVFALFSKTSKHFGRLEQEFMFNFRVLNLEAMLKQLREAGVEVVREEDEKGVGKFAWINDPEGNRVELWQPV